MSYIVNWSGGNRHLPGGEYPTEAEARRAVVEWAKELLDEGHDGDGVFGITADTAEGDVGVAEIDFQEALRMSTSEALATASDLINAAASPEAALEVCHAKIGAAVDQIEAARKAGREDPDTAERLALYIRAARCIRAAADIYI